MEDRYLFESFKKDAGVRFDQAFIGYLNSKMRDNWKVKECSYRREGDRVEASCLFKRII